MDGTLLLVLPDQQPHREVSCGKALKHQAILQTDQNPADVINSLACLGQTVHGVDRIEWTFLAVVCFLSLSSENEADWPPHKTKHLKQSYVIYVNMKKYH